VIAEQFSFPSTILIKISGEDRYYRGTLRDIKRAEEVDRDALLTERGHRPKSWREIDKIEYRDFKNVFYIGDLEEVPRPARIAKELAPQHPHYLPEADLRGDIEPLPEELPWTGSLLEGTGHRTTINAWERNPLARRHCIAHYGASCAVCGFKFGAVYGPLVEGFITVHHLKPLSEIGEEYEVDPITDLRPVCPNCHSVIHKGGECRTIEEARRLVDPRVVAFWASFMDQ
jgi:5-methylcytosine-specific restriction endonuclease McrA